MGKRNFAAKKRARKADREVVLAALGGADRLCGVLVSLEKTSRVTKDFRSLFDSIFSRNHTVTLSRLRFARREISAQLVRSLFRHLSS